MDREGGTCQQIGLGVSVCWTERIFLFLNQRAEENGKKQKKPVHGEPPCRTCVCFLYIYMYLGFDT